MFERRDLVTERPSGLIQWKQGNLILVLKSFLPLSPLLWPCFLPSKKTSILTLQLQQIYLNFTSSCFGLRAKNWCWPTTLAQCRTHLDKLMTDGDWQFPLHNEHPLKCNKSLMNYVIINNFNIFFYILICATNILAKLSSILQYPSTPQQYLPHGHL